MGMRMKSCEPGSRIPDGEASSEEGRREHAMEKPWSRREWMSSESLAIFGSVGTTPSECFPITLAVVWYLDSDK